MRILGWFFSFFVVSIVALGVAAWYLLGPVSGTSKPGVFLRSDVTLDVPGDLARDGYIRSANAFQLLYLVTHGDKKIEVGGYELDPSMNSWEIAEKLSKPPDLVWVHIPPGVRKEQAGEILAKNLGWDDAELSRWNNLYTIENKPEYAEGVYFPDSYLIPRKESVEQVAQRIINRFNEVFAPYERQFAQKNILWTSGLKIASLIQREAGGTHDMKLISGVIWNRLNIGMRLEIDATMQYTRGKVNGRWWGGIDLAQKRSDSLYNSYRHKGLPPTPIANPSLAAIDAALNPEETECLFYLHDPTKQIHCAVTYEEHLQNIEKYL